MYKFLNSPYLNTPYMEADKGGGAGGPADDGKDTGGDDPDGDDPDEDAEDPEEKKFSQKEIDDAVQKRLAREKRKWQRENQKKPGDAGNPEDQKDKNPDAEKMRAAEERASALEMKWTCLEHDVKKDCVDDVLALARVHMAKDENADIEDAIDAVLKKYPHFKDGYEQEGDNSTDPQKGWGQRHKGSQPKAATVEDEIRKQLFGK